MPSVNYDRIASMYDRRYEIYTYSGTRAMLQEIASAMPHLRVLELGCGTGEWLSMLDSRGCEVTGIDPSARMLELARGKVNAGLIQGVAEALPLAEASFDLVFCVNALHHFSSPATALREAFRVLRPGGKFLSIGLDPHETVGRWFVYEFFPRTLDIDQERFVSKAQRTAWLQDAGFANITVTVAERRERSASFEEASRDGVLERTFTSQLTVLTDAEYATGIEKIRQHAQNPGFRLYTDMTLYATFAEKPG